MVVILARVQTPHQSPTGRALAQSSGRPFSFTFTFFFILTSQGLQLFVIFYFLRLLLKLQFPLDIVWNQHNTDVKYFTLLMFMSYLILNKHFSIYAVWFWEVNYSLIEHLAFAHSSYLSVATLRIITTSSMLLKFSFPLFTRPFSSLQLPLIPKHLGSFFSSISINSRHLVLIFHKSIWFWLQINFTLKSKYVISKT